MYFSWCQVRKEGKDCSFGLHCILPQWWSQNSFSMEYALLVIWASDSLLPVPKYKQHFRYHVSNHLQGSSVICVPVNLTIQLGVVQAISCCLFVLWFHQDWQRRKNFVRKKDKHRYVFSWVGSRMLRSFAHRPKESASVLTSSEGGSGLLCFISFLKILKL